MTKEFLQSCLAEGLSLERIAALVDRDPSTVSYHLKKHGLEPAGHDKHASSGKVDPDDVRRLVDEGESIHGIAARLSVSYSTARYWIRRLGLQTERMVRLDESRAARESGLTQAVATCATHGQTLFLKSPSGGFKCGKCRSEAVSRHRRRTKQRLIERAGGSCALCGYDRSPRALQFHHVDPGAKGFMLSRHGVTRSFEEACEEADKCVLLCANCHAEVEDGTSEVPGDLLPLELLPAADPPSGRSA